MNQLLEDREHTSLKCFLTLETEDPGSSVKVLEDTFLNFLVAFLFLTNIFPEYS